MNWGILSCLFGANKSNGLDGYLKAVAFMYDAIYFVIVFA
ncbi:hypothetical protein SUBVAR_04488 [Subdoligranulum variabile DSM 15176]|uniref:Uncharacterized protein n=1 Tax=Subdoligranulum variabile DSM 15176 TaxID=411471 RepID=D1PJG7_9FIRM|nr:hypothetical protein SUBVAR_04488 [Subdoligranulum variabile DSM 15176]